MDTMMVKAADLQLTEYELFMIESLFTRFIASNNHRSDLPDFERLRNRISDARWDLQS